MDRSAVWAGTGCMAVSPISGLRFMAPPCSEYHIRDIRIGRPPHGGKWGNSLVMLAIHHPPIHRSTQAIDPCGRAQSGPKSRSRQAGSGGLFCSSHSPSPSPRAHAHLMIKARGGGGGSLLSICGSNSFFIKFHRSLFPPRHSSSVRPSVHSFSKCIDSTLREREDDRESGEDKAGRRAIQVQEVESGNVGCLMCHIRVDMDMAKMRQQPRM